MEYVVRRAEPMPELAGLWDGPAWSRAETLDVAIHRPEGSDHRPRTRAKALYDADALYVLFRVEDRYVRCTRTDFNSSVCKDSCVEFFFRPKPDRGYLNIEMNCGGTAHVSYIEDETRTPDGFVKFAMVPPSLGRTIRTYHSMPAIVYPEIGEAVEWTVEYAFPLAIVERCVGPLGDLAGQTWRANFYKCADESSHPHWVSWAPLADELNFHLPQHFAPIRFE